MTTFLRIIRLVAIGAWFGSLAFFGVVAAVAFSTMPTPLLAGTIVRGTLLDLHRFGLAEGGIFLLATLGLLFTQRDTHTLRLAELAIVCVMLGLTAYSQFSIMPRMERDRSSVGGDISKAAPDNPAAKHFNRLHGLSVKFEGTVLIGGLLLLCMSAVHGREVYERFN
ncbi:MAG: DUF4149 domain-containing protein [Acidobacteriota bacterium]